MPWTAVIVVTLIVAAVWWTQRGSNGPPEVTARPAGVIPLEASFTAEGFVRGKEYPLAAEVLGRVSEMLVKEGDPVAAGQVLFRLDPVEADANLAQALAAQAQAQNESARAVAALDASSKQVEARVASASSEVARAEAALREVRAGSRAELIEQALQRVRRAEAAQVEAEQARRRAEVLEREGVIPRAQLEAAHAAAIEAEAAATEARSAVAMLRAGPTPEQVAVAQRTVDSARHSVRLAESGRAELSVLRRGIDTSRAAIQRASAAVASARALMRKLAVVSPVDGYVVRLYGEQGTVAGPSTPSLLVAARKDMHIDAEVSSEDAAKLRVGMPLRVTSPAYPGVTFSAKLERVSEIGELKPDAAIRTRIVRARVALDEGWGRFRPGMEVDVEGSRVLREALAVPSDAIHLEDSRTLVFVVEGQRARHREVRTGLATMSATEIVSGLRPGERVVVDGKEGLVDGAEVRERP